jgi:ABC-type glycerol-3-phosphate transport system substrate-binding protein
MKSTLRTIAASLALVMLAACGSSTSTTTDTEAIASGGLSGICPDTVTFQTDWNPESEHGFLYQLVGTDYEVDAAGLRVTGPLVASGVDTGVKVQVRAGGPAVGFTSPTSLMYSDPDIFLAFAATFSQVQNSGEFPTRSVIAPFNINPQVIMWDPATYPDVKTIADLKATGAKVRYFGGTAYMDFFTSTGILDPAQVDGSYDGTPANFVADGGKSAQQGFATSEPYFYENVLADWGKPVAYQTIHDAGWTSYAQTLAGKPEVIAASGDCLKLLVPMIQQSQVDYVADPSTTNALILDLVGQYNNGWMYDAGQADAAVTLALENRLIANSPDGTLGSFDMQRMDDFLALAIPIFEGLGEKVKPGLTSADLVTNEFINPAIALP